MQAYHFLLCSLCFWSQCPWTRGQIWPSEDLFKSPWWWMKRFTVGRKCNKETTQWNTSCEFLALDDCPCEYGACPCVCLSLCVCVDCCCLQQEGEQQRGRLWSAAFPTPVTGYRKRERARTKREGAWEREGGRGVCVCFSLVWSSQLCVTVITRGSVSRRLLC